MSDMSAISAMQQAQYGDRIAVAVVRKGMDAQEQKGEAVVSLLEDALEMARAGAGQAMHPNQTVEFIG